MVKRKLVLAFVRYIISPILYFYSILVLFHVHSYYGDTAHSCQVITFSYGVGMRSIKVHLTSIS